MIKNLVVLLILSFFLFTGKEVMANFDYGINYNPTSVTTGNLDINIKDTDIEKIKSLNIKVIGTYNAGYCEWGNYSNISIGSDFYGNLYPLAEKYGIKIIVGYLSNATIDWTDKKRVELITKQYKNLVLLTKNKQSTYMYLIGNEIFNKLPNNRQRQEYSKWIGDMTDWTHKNGKMVTYADEADNNGIYWLKKYAPKLDIYSVNDYTWTNASELLSIIDKIDKRWHKPIFLHEFGTDSFDTITGVEDEDKQSLRVANLVSSIEEVKNKRINFVGAMLFEFSDEWNKEGFNDRQNTVIPLWPCNSCYDGVPNEEYWGIFKNTFDGSQRIPKKAYWLLKDIFYRIL